MYSLTQISAPTGCGNNLYRYIDIGRYRYIDRDNPNPTCVRSSSSHSTCARSPVWVRVKG